jgi:hypothetical protein
MVEQPGTKSLVEIGAHDDQDALELARHFKQVHSHYEFVKIPERREGNLDIKKVPYLDVLKQLEQYDVILLKNEFHHFPDIWQMWTYDKLSPRQELLLVEWDFRGTNNHYYSSFQNCRPLCELTREVLGRFVDAGIITIEEQAKGKYEEVFPSREALIDYYRFLLPDHWKFGEKMLFSKIAGAEYPVPIWEGFDLFKIGKL